MYQVKTFNAISPAGLERFSSQYQVNQTDNPDAYLIRSVDLHNAEFPEQLKVIARAGIGFNNIPLDQVTEHGIASFNTPGSNAQSVKEVMIGMLVASARHLFGVTKFTAENIDIDISLMKKTDDRFKGIELAGKKLAVIGLGNVGSLVANAAVDLGMKVTGYDPYLSADAAWRISRDVVRADTMAEAIQDADFVTVHVPKNETTVGLIDQKAIQMMKPTTHLFNYSRLGIVDNEAVVKALNNDKLATYITDFGQDILRDNPKIVVTPHIGGSTVEAEANGSIRGANIIMEYLETGNVKGALNLPDLSTPFKTAYRLTIIHQNVPNMVGKISTALANDNLNIEGMSNAAKDKVAYTIIDLTEKPNQTILDELNANSNIYRARLIQNQN